MTRGGLAHFPRQIPCLLLSSSFFPGEIPIFLGFLSAPVKPPGRDCGDQHRHRAGGAIGRLDSPAGDPQSSPWVFTVFYGIHGLSVDDFMGYPLVNVYILRTGKIHRAINGKIHYFDWAIFNCELLVHQRVSYFRTPPFVG